MAKKAKSSFKFKDLLLKKGEKIGLIVAIGVFAIFLLIGFSSMSGAVNPNDNKKAIDRAADNLQNGMKDTIAKATPLEPWAVPGQSTNDFTQVSSTTFTNRVAPFEPSSVPSIHRDNPTVKSPIESQVNYFAGSYKGYDRLFEKNEAGDVVNVRFGVLKVVTKSDFQWDTLQNKLKNPKKPGPQPKGPNPTRPMQVPPLNPPAGERIQSGKPGSTNGERDDFVVQYMTEEEAIKSKLPPARTIYPVRMAVVQLSFPLKEQLEEIRNRLRLPNLAAAKLESSQATIDARAAKPGTPGVPVPPSPVPSPPGGGGTGMLETDDSPTFVGLVVERRITGPDGQPSGWEAFDHQDKFEERFNWYDTPFVQEDGYLPYFLRPYQGLSSPYPVMAGGYLLNYPPNVSLPSIYANYQKLLAEKAPKKVGSELLSKFKKGTHNPYMPSTPNQGSQPGGFGTEETRPPAFTLPPGARPGPESTPGVPGTVDPNKLDVEYILLRFLDTELKPGHTYEYRVKVRMKNPNFNNPTKVANESMAAEETLESAWYEVSQKVTVPGESFLYAFSVKQYEENVKKMYEEAGKPELLNVVMETKEVQEGRKVVVQMQRWMEYLSFGAKQEPIGAWIQAEMPVGPGDFIGRRTLVELPLWRSSVKDPKATKETTDPYSGGYVLPLPDPRSPMIARWPTDSKKYTLPRARILDFRTPHVLIDFDGGRVTTKAGSNTQVDDAAAELLILRDDGKIEIRRESIDMANTNPLTPRAQREKTWDEWLARVRKQNEPETTGTTPGGNGFGPVRGGAKD